MNFSFKYAGNFCIAERPSPLSSLPGQCFVIDEKYYAIAKRSPGIVKFVTKKGSHLDCFNKDIYSFVGPVGAGFSNCDAKRAVVIAGGTGIGAAINLLESRSQDLETHLIFYSREESPLVDICRELGANPPTNSIVQWNTALNGRPKAPLDPFVKREHSYYDLHVFVVGPKSLVDSTREQCKLLGIPEANFHLNY